MSIRQHIWCWLKEEMMMTASELIGWLAENFGDGDEVTLSVLSDVLSA